ncbi:TetR/AcrR family transcriptional regulator (plasmid) [Hymenobacter volaticus]|uniref:TetR/AcrR family transcriptional regulator n=2 Tax=Hymenobacter volaticus TaxID=2932254 RepID=A0ABY4GEU3_9BACT|nr:TetR/AcrR family transcriptional regulator [Hymenobacter volaticus]UOQ69271.1 TetR/AcrR family transcriptional regulator [Hymenobacter volaticus]
MSFYKHFPSKQALVVAFLQERHQSWQQQLEQQAKARSNTPAEEIRAVFHVLKEWFGEADFRGCAFINTVLETADPHTQEHLLARQHKDVLRTYLEGLLREGPFRDPAQGLPSCCCSSMGPSYGRSLATAPRRPPARWPWPNCYWVGGSVPRQSKSFFCPAKLDHLSFSLPNYSSFRAQYDFAFHYPYPF